VTCCPCSGAWDTISWSVAPVAPRTTSFSLGWAPLSWEAIAQTHERPQCPGRATSSNRDGPTTDGDEFVAGMERGGSFDSGHGQRGSLLLIFMQTVCMIKYQA